MTINYGYEYKKFEKEQEEQKVYYLSLGMSEEAVETIAAFDKEAFLSRLRFMKHTQPLSVLNGDGNDDESTSPLFEKFIDRLSVTIDTYRERDRYGWIEELENPLTIKVVKRLTSDQIELLTLIAIEGYSQKEAGLIIGINQSNVSRRFSKIQKIFDEVFENAHKNGLQNIYQVRGQISVSPCEIIDN